MSKTTSEVPVLRLMGCLEVDAAEAGSLPRKVKALAACVALHGTRGIGRERLAALFWEERAEEQARASLRQALSLLRRSLGDGLVTDDGHVRLDPAAVSVDVWAFEEKSAAFCHYWDATMGWDDDDAASLRAASEWAERASGLEDADGQAHAILAHVSLLERDHDDALRLAEEAIAIRSQCATTNALYANSLLWCGRPGEALERVDFAIRAAPVYASWWVEILAAAYRDLGRHEMAEAAARELLRRKPESLEARILLAGALAAQDRPDEAGRIGSEIMTLDPRCTAESLARCHPYRCKADLDRLLSLLEPCGVPA